MRRVPLLICLLLPAPLTAQEFPRSKQEIAEVLRNLSRVELEAGESELELQRRAALRRLQAYRFLSGLPWQDMVMSKRLNELAEAAAYLCKKSQRIAHFLPNPGLSRRVYHKGLTGIRGSNLSFGYPRFNLIKSVDGYLDDSDGDNIAQIGHRAWCLNPKLKKVGFGIDGKYAAMMCQDMSRKMRVPDHVSHPGPGYYPLNYFAQGRPWSVHLNREVYGKPVLSRIELRLYHSDQELQLEFLEVSLADMGMGYSIIFRPQQLILEDGSSYRVELEVPRLGQKKRERITYVVRFFDT